jgi:hypothetical protein
MPREFMCQYGNCTYTADKLPVIVTVDNRAAGKEQPRFCCLRHASMWLANEADREEPHTMPPGCDGAATPQARRTAWARHNAV